MSYIQISNTVVGYCWHVVKPFIAVLVLYSSAVLCAVVGSTLYWMGVDMHGPHYGWSMCQALAMLLVPDRQIDGRASTEVRRVENKMMVIMQEHQEREQHNVSHNSFHSSFSRIRSEELNDMGYGLSRISPITFDDDAFWTLSNRAKDRALTLTPRKKKNETNTGSAPTTQTPHQDRNAK